MDLVEEFLELGKNVTVTNLVELLRVLRRRIPGRYLPKNLKDLVGIDETDTKNIGRHFWSWLNKQKWRKMLPRPFPIHSMYTYDVDLFRDRWLGPPGALEQFWNAQRETEWFKMHPILSNPALIELTEDDSIWPGDHQDERLRMAFVQFTSECKRHGVRNRGQIFSVKQMYPLGKGNYPTLVQKHFNGAEATVLAKWLKGVTLAVAAANPASEHCALRASIFVNLVAMRSAVGRGRNDWCVLKPQNLSLLQRANFLLHSALNSLATEAIDKEVLLWKIRPKIHQIDHLCIDQAALMNPLTLSTYDDEDFIGKRKGLAMRSDVRAMGYQTLHRYAAYVCCRWLRQLTGS